MEVGFSLGTNLGDRFKNLTDAKERLLAFDDTELLALSSAYDTQPVGVKDEYMDMTFLNSVVIINTSASCETWLERIGNIEQELGRVREGDRNAPRPIDIDILYAGDAIIDSGGLQVPHPRWAERRFVVEPLAEVRPELVLPGIGEPVARVLEGLAAGEAVAKLEQGW